VTEYRRNELTWVAGAQLAYWMATSVAHATHIDDAVIDAVAARAWPAKESVTLGPWTARWNSGHPFLPNSVATPGQVAPQEVAALVTAAEDFYAARSGPARFEVSDTARNAAVVAALRERGYRPEEGQDRVVQVAPLRSMRAMAPADRDGRMQITEEPTDAWLARWWASSDREVGEAEQESIGERFWEIPGRCGFAAHVVDGLVVATGLGVVDGPWIGLSCMATDVARRGRGSGRRVLGALATWGLAHAARVAYVQVDAANPAALRLSAAAGLETAYRQQQFIAP
jgi:GNAT superfamily N-acetyltransferase